MLRVSVATFRPGAGLRGDCLGTKSELRYRENENRALFGRRQSAR